MKHYYSFVLKMILRTIVFSFALIILLPGTTFAQCTGGASGGALSPAPAAAYQTMAVAAGQYYTFVVAAGCLPTYIFTFCSNGGSAAFDSQITILNSVGAYAGGYNDDFCALQSQVTWTPTAAGTYRVLINNYPCASSGAAATLAYNMTTPPSMTFTSCTTVQASTATVTKCDFDQEVISVQVVTSGTCSPMSVTQFQLGAGGSTSATLADVSKIHIYYTGTTNSFSTTSEFLSGGTTPAGGSNTINGSQALAAGTNYFWIAYDINPAATTSNVVDASCTQITVAAVARVPTATNPAGTRTINVCSVYPGTSALGLKNWLKSDVGVTGSPVSSWADQSGAAITGNLNQGTAANRPSVQTGLINFQNYIRFDGVNDILVSASTFAGNSLFSTTDNSILMVKNYKAGLVDYKWETDPTNSWRIGWELNAGTQRIDFVDDNGGGKNDLSTTSILNKDVIAEYISDATTVSLKLNGNTDAVKTHPSLLFNPPGATLKALNIGGNDLGNPLYCQVDIAEVMTYNKKLSSSEIRRVESYLSLKYGITMGNNKGTGASVTYMGSDGAQIWSNQTGYHNYVIGIGRDNAAGNSGLNKLRSASVLSLNGSTDILTLTNGTTPWTGAAFGTDKSFLIVGRSNGNTYATAASISDIPAGIQTRLECVWKAQETGTVGTVTLKFNMAAVTGVAGVAGANNYTDMRLLVDADGVFAAGATLYSPVAGDNTADTVVFQVDLVAGTGFYFTIGSINIATAPLPIELLDFKANCVNDKVTVRWTTATEVNNDYFTLDRANDGVNFSTVAIVNGAGNSSQQHQYVWTDDQPYEGNSYYRLQQTDFDGTTKIFNVVQVSCQDDALNDLSIVNTFSNGYQLQLDFNTSLEGLHCLKLLDVTGSLVFSEEKYFSKGQHSENIDLGQFAEGIYIINIRNRSDHAFKKVVIVKK